MSASRFAVRLAVLFAVLAAPALAAAWGWQAHKLVTRLAVDLLPAELKALYTPLMDQLLEQTVQPDKRVFSDPREGPKHFLNVEVLDTTYRAAWSQAEPSLKKKPRHKKKGRAAKDEAPPPPTEDGPSTPPLQLAVFEKRMPLPASEADFLFASLPPDEAAFHALPPAMQKEMGSVVYQPAHYRAELVKAFRSGDTARIAGVTGYLSHYVGDLHVPLHNTIDHEGAFSHSARAGKGQNNTVHSRFETGFVKFLGPALDSLVARQLKPPAPQPAASLTARVIREARQAYAFYPEVIRADAATMATHHGKTIAWARFYGDFEPKMAPVVATQLARSSQMLADIIVGAWNESRGK